MTVEIIPNCNDFSSACSRSGPHNQTSLSINQILKIKRMTLSPCFPCMKALNLFPLLDWYQCQFRRKKGWWILEDLTTPNRQTQRCTYWNVILGWRGRNREGPVCKEQPSVQISRGSPSLLKTATEPRRVIQSTRRLSLVQAMSAIHQDLKIEM